jgi:hypothetical protein
MEKLVAASRAGICHLTQSKAVPNDNGPISERRGRHVNTRSSSGVTVASSAYLLTLFALFLLVPNLGMATTNALSPDGQFVITHNFLNIVIGEQQQRSVRAFVDVQTFAPPDHGKVNTLPDQDEVGSLAIHLLESKVQLVARKDDANIFVEILMYQTINYAIRNLKGEPAKGFILVGICKYPIMETAKDCDNQTYFYFADYRPSDVFEKVFGMWSESVFPRVAR